MIKLNLPEYEFNYRRQNGRVDIFDAVRQCYVALTHEEWVRQNFVQFLIQQRNYPASLMGIEKEITVNKMKKRVDVIMFSQQGQPLALVECKAPNISLTMKVFEQIARYNLAFKVELLIVTNGLIHYCCRLSPGRQQWDFLNEIPEYSQLISHL